MTNYIKVILQENVINLGRVSDIVSVRSGYGRYLLTQSKALRANKANLELFASKKLALQEQDKNLLQLAQSAKSDLQDKKIKIIKQASDNGILYAAVKAKEILLHINNLIENKLEQRYIVVKKVIKNVGVHTVSLCIHPDCEFDINIYIAVSEKEADKLIETDK